ncbi:M56 family metallopeptidase [Rhodanobacter sp. L36]|uniref:M56 family metallopeptidase n=1 Tax=Rhodanobacter sp. L36 TaxID=1747221 RepID=UPI00131D26BE|nr:M56 family metallopeptidase [Rhodanobacter sp. L36]
MNAELMSLEWIGRGWLLILAFTVAAALVFVLRKPFRHLFGTELAFQLWWLPPLAMLASQWTHAANVSAITFFPTVLKMTSIVAALPARATESGVTEWRVWAAWLWISGSLVSLVLAMLGQWRYRRHLRGATLVKGAQLRWPVLRAASPDIGPALMGAWRAHIVLPIDFESRYDINEQSLILAHEAVHARRRDGWWCLVARIISAVLWFHPLAWLAMLALRRDQELACDAVVLRELGISPRRYANAMLKTQCAALALPVGCPWSRHPITERIAMLKLKQPDLKRRRIGGVLMTMSALGFTCAVYAATPSTQPRAASIVADHYTLKINVAMGGRFGSRTSSYCVSPNEYVDVDGGEGDKLSWKGKFSVTPVAAGQIEIRSQVYTRFDRGAGRVREQRANPVVRTMPGQEATVVFGQIVDGKHLEKLEDNTIKIAMTPSPGCQDSSTAPGVNSTK